MTPGFGGPWAIGVRRAGLPVGVAGVAPEDGFDPWSRRRRGDRERPIIVLAATIVIMVTKGQLGRAKAATAAGAG